MSTHAARLRVAEVAAQKSTYDLTVRHGASLYVGGRLINFGWNKARKDPKYCDGACTLHAEEDCLRNVRKPQRGMMYVVRINRLGQWRLSKPCDSCMELLKSYEIKRVYWSLPNHECEWMNLNA